MSQKCNGKTFFTPPYATVNGDIPGAVSKLLSIVELLNR